MIYEIVGANVYRSYNSYRLIFVCLSMFGQMLAILMCYHIKSIRNGHQEGERKLVLEITHETERNKGLMKAWKGRSYREFRIREF